MNKKKLFYWSLYDFANSVIYINFLLYFSQWLVINGGLSDFWYNAIFAITSIILFISAPTLAAFTDKYGGRKYLLNFSTIGTLLGYGFATILAYLYPQNIFVIASFFLVGQYFYQLSFVFYNALIDEVSDSEHRSRASGIGQFSNNLGQVIGLIMAIPLSVSRLQPLFPSLVLFILLALPMMIFFRDSKPKERKIDIKILVNGEREYFKKMFFFFSTSVAIPVLASLFFFNDAIITISNNYPIYMERVFAVSDTTKNILLMGILFMSAVGGLISGKIADKIGEIKILKYILISWIILIPLIASSKGLISLSVYSILMGSLIGPVWVVTRAYLSKLLKKEELSYGFSFYTLFERFSTLLGPLAWGGVLVGLGTQHTSYRIAMLSMTVFIMIGLAVLIKWNRLLTPLLS